MDEADRRWQQTGEVIRQRVETLALSIGELEKLAKVDRQTIRPIMQGKRPRYDPRPATVAKISRALGWDGDAIGRMLRGDGAPPIAQVPTPRMTAEERLAALEATVQELRQEVLRLRASDHEDTRERGAR